MVELVFKYLYKKDTKLLNLLYKLYKKYESLHYYTSFSFRRFDFSQFIINENLQIMKKHKKINYCIILKSFYRKRRKEWKTWSSWCQWECSRRRSGLKTEEKIKIWKFSKFFEPWKDRGGLNTKWIWQFPLCLSFPDNAACNPKCIKDLFIFGKKL